MGSRLQQKIGARQLAGGTWRPLLHREAVAVIEQYCSEQKKHQWPVNGDLDYSYSQGPSSSHSLALEAARWELGFLQ